MTLLTRFTLVFMALSLAPVLQAQAVGEELDGFGHDFQTLHGTMNLRVVENRFEAYFVDEDRLVIEPPKRIIMFTEEMRRTDQRDRLVLQHAAAGPFLTNPRIIPPPHDYWVRMVLVASEDDDEHETVARTLFRQPLAAEGDGVDELSPTIER